MPSYVCTFEQAGTRLFFMHSTVTDSPETPAMTEAEFTEWYVQDRLRDIRRELAERMGRAIKNGTSSAHEHTIEELCGPNYAGPEGTQITVPELLDLVVERRKAWNLPALAGPTLKGISSWGVVGPSPAPAAGSGRGRRWGRRWSWGRGRGRASCSSAATPSCAGSDWGAIDSAASTQLAKWRAMPPAAPAPDLAATPAAADDTVAGHTSEGDDIPFDDDDADDDAADDGGES